ncbi:MAG: hypothetical protein GY742_08845 [Hyphomicrobiales bacterium]|nr:hypothetical protein [Hyphomicrobiales bacterium]
MADYYSILKKTISGSAHNSQGTRTAIYDKARTAIDRQLRAMDPIPSEDAIARQMKSLDEAIVKLDTEYGAKEAQSKSSEPKAGLSEPLARDPVQSQAPTTRKPAQQSRQQTKSAGLAASGSLPVNSAPKVSTPAENIGVAPVTAPQVAGVNEPVNVDPRGMEYDETILAAEPDTLARSSVQQSGKPGKRGFLLTLLPIILAFGVVGGGIYALWINKDALIDGLMGDNNQPVIQSSKQNEDEQSPIKPESKNLTETKKVRVVGNDSTAKNPAKLTPEGKTVKVISEPPKVNASGETPSQPMVTDTQNESVAKLETGNNDQQSDEIGEKVVQPVADEQPKVATNEAVSNDLKNQAREVPVEEDTPAKPVDVAPSVAQKAFLYEEGTAGSSASRDNAAIIWSIEREALEDGTSEAVIKGQLDVPGRNLSMSLLIKRNLDESLPASHIIELQFQLPKDFTGGNISDVSRFVMKTSEQGRGEGLIAVPAKISDGNFLIALNNLDQALATNNKLLLDSSWIDVPLGYTTGRRALVTLEKGALGDKVFRDAFAEWAKQ